MTLVAIALVSLIVTADQDWIEVTTGQKSTDDITFLGPLPDSNELWLGTYEGEVYRSFDKGVSWEMVFEPKSLDNLLDMKLKQVRSPHLELDLLRDVNADIPVADRGGSNQRALDLGGQIRGRYRRPTAQLLADLVDNEVRDPGQVNQIDKCFDYIFINSSNGVFRAAPGEPLRFDQLDTGQDLSAGRITWLSCDRKHPGHMIGKTVNSAILETTNYGDTWLAYTNPFQSPSKVSTAGFSEGRLLILAGNHMYREREDQRGYETVCGFTLDSAESQPAWVWRTNGAAYGVTSDGILICDKGKTTRLADERFARKPIVYVQIEGPHNEHIMVVTVDDVYLSHDQGRTFELMFSRPTQRSIDIVLADNLSTFDDAIVWSGNVVFRRANREHNLGATTVDVEEIYNQAPMWEVVEIALRNYQVDSAQIAARRNDSRYQGLLPIIKAAASGNDGNTSGFNIGTKGAGPSLTPFDKVAFQYPNQTIWTIFASWDLAPFLRSSSSTDRSWADVERLRRRMSYRIEDAYTRWANTTLQLRRNDLTVEQRTYLLLQRREMGAYLNYITAGHFDVFGGKAAL